MWFVPTGGQKGSGEKWGLTCFVTSDCDPCSIMWGRTRVFLVTFPVPNLLEMCPSFLIFFCKQDAHGMPVICGLPFRHEGSGTKDSVFEMMSIFYLNWVLSYSWEKGAGEKVVLGIWRFDKMYFLSHFLKAILWFLESGFVFVFFSHLSEW